ncbi:MAG: Gfo/Idh/MocA family oxidoreductase [Bacteroidales bacterium]|jgi:hypothetical protein
MGKKINWGILGLGKIAHKFAEDLRLSHDAMLYAVGSRDLDKAAAFASKHHFAKFHGSYEALASDPGVDVVYIATPHTLHLENTLVCLEKGTEGKIRLHRRFHHTEKITLIREDGSKDIDIPYQGNVYLHEIEEVNRCLFEGRSESPKLPPGVSLDLISVIDRVKTEIGLRY